MVAGIDVQLVVSGCSYPFCWHADELEDEGLDPAALLQSEGFCVKPFHEELVEVADDSCEQEERGLSEQKTKRFVEKYKNCQNLLFQDVKIIVI